MDAVALMHRSQAASLLSAANMLLKLEQMENACELYTRALTTLSLSPREMAMAQEKLAAASAGARRQQAIAASSRPVGTRAAAGLPAPSTRSVPNATASALPAPRSPAAPSTTPAVQPMPDALAAPAASMTMGSSLCTSLGAEQPSPTAQRALDARLLAVPGGGGGAGGGAGLQAASHPAGALEACSSAGAGSLPGSAPRSAPRPPRRATVTDLTAGESAPILEHVIGRGSYGAVWRGHHAQHGAVAVKVVPLEAGSGGGGERGGGDGGDVQSELEGEVDLLTRCAPNCAAAARRRAPRRAPNACAVPPRRAPCTTPLAAFGLSFVLPRLLPPPASAARPTPTSSRSIRPSSPRGPLRSGS